MALVKSGLKSSIQSIINSPGATAAACASSWASAYASYAAGAISPGGGGPASLAGPQAALATALTSTFSGTTLAGFASSFSAAITAFWMAPPVVFAFTAPSTTPGAVTAVAGSAAFISTVTGFSNGTDASAAAQAFADALDTLTKTVTVLHPNAPPGVPPVAGVVS